MVSSSLSTWVPVNSASMRRRKSTKRYNVLGTTEVIRREKQITTTTQTKDICSDQHDMAGDGYSSFLCIFSLYKNHSLRFGFQCYEISYMDMLYETFLRGVILTFELDLNCRSVCSSTILGNGGRICLFIFNFHFP